MLEAAADSFLVPVQLHSALRILVVLQLLHTLLASFCLNHDAGVVVGDETTLDGGAHPLQQAIVVTFDVENDDAASVDAQLIPSCDLHKLFHGSITTAQSDEAAALAAVHDLASHSLLPRVHVCDYGGTTKGGLVNNRVQRGALLVVAFVFYEGFGDDAVHSVRTSQGDEGFGNLTHDANGTAAVYQFHVVLVEGFCQFAGSSKVGRRVATRGTAAIQRASDMALHLDRQHTYKTQTTGLFDVADEGATASPALSSILAVMAIFGSRACVKVV
jgi:hypothetical protein